MVVFVVDILGVEGWPSIFVVVGWFLVLGDCVCFGELGAFPVLLPGDLKWLARQLRF